IQRRLSRGTHGRDRRKSGSRRQRNRREAKESTETDKGDRSGIGLTEKPGSNWREEKIARQIAQETEATCHESTIAVAGVGDPGRCPRPKGNRLDIPSRYHSA